MESAPPATSQPGTIGIIGAGHIGQALARTALRAGRKVLIANSRGPESLAAVVAALGEGVSAGTVRDAATPAIVAIAVPWANVPSAVDGLRWDGQTVIDTTNAWNADLGGRTSSEIVADLVPRRGRQGRQHACGGGAGGRSSRGGRPSGDLPVRRRSRGEGRRDRAVRRRRLLRDRPRWPGDRRAHAATGRSAAGAQPRAGPSGQMTEAQHGPRVASEGDSKPQMGCG
jgi:NADP oxidoreductase coenzyme F420-dependent